MTSDCKGKTVSLQDLIKMLEVLSVCGQYWRKRNKLNTQGKTQTNPQWEHTTRHVSLTRVSQHREKSWRTLLDLQNTAKTSHSKEMHDLNLTMSQENQLLESLWDRRQNFNYELDRR